MAIVSILFIQMRNETAVTEHSPAKVHKAKWGEIQTDNIKQSSSKPQGINVKEWQQKDTNQKTNTIAKGVVVWISYDITKTRLYNPLKPHFYIVKLGFTGVCIIFLILLKKNIDCGYALEPNLCFEQEHEKYQIFLSENLSFSVVKFSIYLNRRVFVMYTVDSR